jgi:N-acetylglutamate synthase-like GNAT family acetyltransferase
MAVAKRPVVRQALDSDLPKIAEHYIGETLSPWHPFSSVDRLKAIPRNGLLVAEVDASYAGFLYWFAAQETRSDSAVENFAQIVTVRVRKEFWNGRVGLSLLAFALKDIERQEIPKLYVDAPEGNTHLRSLYEQVGFSTFDRTLHMRFLYPPDRHRTQRPLKESRELLVLLIELREQCRVALTSHSELMELLSRPPSEDPDDQRGYSARVWSRIQATLASCSIISKILWPNVSKRRDLSDEPVVHRGRELRQFIKLRGPSPFPIAVRNAFEHIDERLIEWLPNQGNDVPWGWSLSPYVNEEEPVDSSKAFRYFNLNTKELRVANARCNLKEIVEHVRRIVDLIPAKAQVTFGHVKN